MSEKAEVIQNYLRILEAVPTNVPAFEALKKIFNEEEQWADLAQLYENRAGNVGQDQAPSLFLQAAALRLHKLQDPASAVKSIQKLLQLDPNNGQALALWRQISLKSGDYPTAIKILRQESQLSDDNGRKAAIFIDIAQIFEEHLSNPKNAAVAYHQAFILNPGEIEAMEQALRLYWLSAILITVVSFALVWSKGTIEPAVAGLALTYSLMLTSILQWTVRIANMTENTMTAVERLLHYRSISTEAAEVCPEVDPPATWPANGSIEFKDLYLRYRPELDLVLKGINLSIKGGEKIG